MIPHLIPAALGDYLNLPRAASHSAGQHTAQLRLAKSASQSSAVLTTQLCASHSAKHQSQAMAVKHFGSELSFGENQHTKKSTSDQKTQEIVVNSCKQESAFLASYLQTLAQIN